MGHLGLGVHQSMLTQSSSESGILNCLKTIFCSRCPSRTLLSSDLEILAPNVRGYVPSAFEAYQLHLNRNWY
jgi:hypothetical protein